METLLAFSGHSTIINKPATFRLNAVSDELSRASRISMLADASFASITSDDRGFQIVAFLWERIVEDIVLITWSRDRDPFIE